MYPNRIQELDTLQTFLFYIQIVFYYYESRTACLFGQCLQPTSIKDP